MINDERNFKDERKLRRSIVKIIKKGAKDLLKENKPVLSRQEQRLLNQQKKQNEQNTQ